jgi:tetraacyldisaccharide-1-P 4'-kinase
MIVEFECRLDRRQAAAFLTARGYRTGCKSVVVRTAIDVDRLAGDEAAILAD